MSASNSNNNSNANQSNFTIGGTCMSVQAQ